MTVSLVRKTRIGLGIALASLLVIGILSDRTIVASRDNTEALQHSHETLTHLANALSALESIHGNSRGFALTGQAVLLDSVPADQRRVADAERSLAALLADDPGQQSRLAALARLSRQRIEQALETVRLRRTNGIAAAAALVGAGEGTRLMNESRALVHEMEREENRILAQRNAEGLRRSLRARTTLIVGIAVGVLVAIVGGIMVRGFGVRERAEEQVRHQRLLLESVFGSLRDGVIAADQDGKFLLFNDAAQRMIGVGVDVDPSRWTEHYGVFQTDRITPYPTEDLPLVRAIRGEPTDDVPMIIRQARLASDLWVSVSGRPLRDREGALRGGVVILNDMTSRRATESELLQSDLQLVQKIEELKRSNNELEQFAYVTSHDLQEPLRMVSSYTQLLAKNYKGRLGADADEFITYAVDGATRMRRLIQDLLAYSRAGASDGPAVEIASEDALSEALANLEGAVKDSEAVVTHGPLPRVTMNHLQLVQIFQNLIGNAIKYRGADAPLIHVTARSEHGHSHVFSVQDNGLGIDPQQFARIFVIFQRLHGRDAFTGTGIGLAICKKLVERSGGRIWVDSEPGHGSTFHFDLLKEVSA